MKNLSYWGVMGLLGFGMISTKLSSTEVLQKKKSRKQPIEIEEPVKEKTVYDIDTSDILMKAMIMVESRGTPNAIGDSGKAVGILQIHPIKVRSVNQILEKLDTTLRYTYNDRFDPIKSMEMYWLWRNYRRPNASDEEIARIWNGGPRGMEKTSTIKYWNKVQKWMNK